MLRSALAFEATDFPDPHTEAHSLYLSNHDATSVLNNFRGIRPRTSFYVDCGFFGSSGKANPEDAGKTEVKEEQELLLSQFEELSGHAEDQRIADPYYKEKVTPDLNTALMECLRTRGPKHTCSAVCRNDAGSTVFHEGQLKMGFGDPIKDTPQDRGPWTCLAKKDMAPIAEIQGDHLEKCWSDMFDGTQGMWDDSKIPRFSVQKDKDSPPVQLVLADGPVNKEDLEDTKIRCEQDEECEAVCVHKEAPYRGVLYGHFEDAKCALDPEACKAHKDILAGGAAAKPSPKPKKTVAQIMAQNGSAQKSKSAKKLGAAKTVARGVGTAAVHTKGKTAPPVTSEYAAPESQHKQVPPVRGKASSFKKVTDRAKLHRLPKDYIAKTGFVDDEEGGDTTSGGTFGSACPAAQAAEDIAKNGGAEPLGVMHGKCVICQEGDGGAPSSLAQHEAPSPQEDQDGHRQETKLGEILFLPTNKATEAIKNGYCRGLGETKFPCSCVDDADPEAAPEHKWGAYDSIPEPSDDPTKVKMMGKTKGMMKECSMKCRNAAYNAAFKEDPEKAKKDVDQAVLHGYELLAPQVDEDAMASFNKKFWKQALQPVKEAEDTWLKEQFPEEDPLDNPNREGATEFEKETAGGIGNIGDPDKAPSAKDAKNRDGAEHPDMRNWECYFLSHKCRKQAKHRAELKFQQLKEDVKEEEEDLKLFSESLEKTPQRMFQGSGTSASAEFWAKTSAPKYEKENSGNAIVKLRSPKQAATLSDPRIKEWSKQCKSLGNLLPFVEPNLKTWDDKMFKADMAITQNSNKTFIKEVNGRWLECKGGLTQDKAPDTSAAPAVSSLSQSVSGLASAMARASGAVNPDPLIGTRDLKCRPLHEEPLENCNRCGDQPGQDPQEFVCLGAGYNGIPKGEFSPLRSLLTPVDPQESPLETHPGASSALNEVRKNLATVEKLSERQYKKIGLLEQGDLRCVHIGQPGQVKSNDADRILFAAEMPWPALLAAAASSSRHTQIGRAAAHRKTRQLSSFL